MVSFFIFIIFYTNERAINSLAFHIILSLNAKMFQQRCTRIYDVKDIISSDYVQKNLFIFYYSNMLPCEICLVQANLVS